MLEKVFKVSFTIIGSVGGAGALILYFSNWLGKVWATKIAEEERQVHRKEIEKFKSDLQQLSHSRKDFLTRKREVYQQMAVSMRIFIEGSSPSSEEDKNNFLNTYDLCYLWGSDEVLNIIGDFLELNIKQARNPTADNQNKMKKLYSKCLIEMRKDSGHVNTKLNSDSYKFVKFN
ncbi:hypothetical protein C8C78_1662 [Halanaerobium congolense]|jgi:hypothetical protein|uniref:Uncharacterized protein n=1 Tax=Halanaerobium congolense TaxID=54121 RepID=A0A318DTV0_9FIRM|nr:hypothetical protein [Halanaerobium congolense]PXV59972.1 hypothetical protein C8C78_1662 [Halanaerobium congolense]